MRIQQLLLPAFIVLLFMVTSCRKEDPKPAASSSTASSSTFFFKADIGGEPVLIEGGFNDYFMATSIEEDVNGVANFVGVLKVKGCETGCVNSLKISIKDYRETYKFSSSMDSSLFSGYYAIATPSGTPSKYSNLFIGGLNNGNSQSFIWDFGDGTVSSPQTSAYVEHNYLHPGNYSVSLTSTSTDGCQSTITKMVQFGQTGNSFLSDFTEKVIGDTTTFIPIPLGGIPPYTYLWDFGDGSTSTESSPRHGYSKPGIYDATLSITDLFGSTSVQISSVMVNSNTCSSFIILPTPTAIANPMNLGAVEIEWTDAEGEVWTSNHSRQLGTNSIFKVTSVKDYLNNQDGYPTKKIEASISCKLYNGFRSLTITEGKASFALAY